MCPGLPVAPRRFLPCRRKEHSGNGQSEFEIAVNRLVMFRHGAIGTTEHDGLGIKRQL
jgi:hypothetical protein